MHPCDSEMSDLPWPWVFCLWAPAAPLSALSLWPPGSAAESPPSSPSPVCALWWPLPAGPAEDSSWKKGYIGNWSQLVFTCALRCSTPDACNKRCVYVVPGWPVVGAPPVFPSGHYPCLTPHEFSLPTPSWYHCRTTDMHKLNMLLLNNLSDVCLVTKTNTQWIDCVFKKRPVKPSDCEGLYSLPNSWSGEFLRLLSTIFKLTFSASTCSVLQGV